MNAHTGLFRTNVSFSESKAYYYITICECCMMVFLTSSVKKERKEVQEVRSCWPSQNLRMASNPTRPFRSNPNRGKSSARLVGTGDYFPAQHNGKGTTSVHKLKGLHSDRAHYPRLISYTFHFHPNTEMKGFSISLIVIIVVQATALKCAFHSYILIL